MAINNNKNMGKTKELIIEKQQERFNRKLAVLMDITYNEFLELDYIENTNESNDGIILYKVYEFKDDSPRYILDKIVGLDDNNQFWLSIDAIPDDEYSYYED